MLQENKLKIDKVLYTNSDKRHSLQTACTSTQRGSTLTERKFPLDNEATKRLRAVENEIESDVNPFEYCCNFDMNSPLQDVE